MKIFSFFFTFTLLFGLLISSCSDDSSDTGARTDYSVSNIDELNDVLSLLKAGDVVTLKDGTWENVSVLFSGYGKEGDSITFKSESVGGVVFTGNSTMKIMGSYLIVDGFSFENGNPTSGSVIEFKRGGSESQHCRLTNVSVKDYSSSDKMVDTKWVSLYGRNNRVDHCSFEGKTNMGTTLVVWLDGQPNHHRIDHNYFGPRPDLGENGGETIRIGTSDWSLSNSNTIVEHNLFEECDGEIEIISNKSCENIYRYNTFLNSNGALTLRHGNNCEVYNNYFINTNEYNRSGGVRVIGEGHKIYNNYFEGLRSDKYRAVISLTNGETDAELNGYAPVKDVEIGFNTIVNCREPFAVGYGFRINMTVAPENVMIANNLVQTYSTYSMAKVYDASADVTWVGNLVDGNSGLTDEEGVKSVSLTFSTDGDIMRPDASVLESNLASNDMSYVNFDINEQIRPSDLRYVGCDQIVDSSPLNNKPKSRDEVGVRNDRAMD